MWTNACFISLIDFFKKDRCLSVSIAQENSSCAVQRNPHWIEFSRKSPAPPPGCRSLAYISPSRTCSHSSLASQRHEWSPSVIPGIGPQLRLPRPLKPTALSPSAPRYGSPPMRHSGPGPPSVSPPEFGQALFMLKQAKLASSSRFEAIYMLDMTNETN
jgi:hypothetical protein